MHEVKDLQHDQEEIKYDVRSLQGDYKDLVGAQKDLLKSQHILDDHYKELQESDKAITSDIKSIKDEIKLIDKDFQGIAKQHLAPLTKELGAFEDIVDQSLAKLVENDKMLHSYVNRLAQSDAAIQKEITSNKLSTETLHLEQKLLMV